MTLAVRPAALSDAAVIAKYNRLLALETEGKTLDNDIVMAGVAALLADPHKGRYLVAEADGQVVGQTAITFEWSDWRNGWIWWIQSVYVCHEARRRGVFQALYQRIYEEAQATPGVIGLRLSVERGNQVAQQTYRDLGMEEAGYFIFQRYPL